VINAGEREIAQLAAIEVNLRIRTSPSKRFDCHQAKLETSSGRSWPRIEDNPISLGCRISAVDLRVAAEIEMARGHVEIFSHLQGQPAACGNAMEAHSVGIFGQNAI
jgi:hypothetical protein